MLFATLKAFHLLAVIVWVGGMAFVLFCLRPAAHVLETTARVTLMHAAMRRFLAVVVVAVAVIFVSGGAMVAIAWSTSARAGLALNMPLNWYTMIAVFFVMLAVFVHIRNVLFARLDAAVREKRWADGAAALAAMRWELSINLVLGAFVSVFVRLGGTA
ncbi:MAG: CopD family protein [Caldimonas sp.]